MMNSLRIAFYSALLSISCSGSVLALEPFANASTVEGKVVEVVPAKREIYVRNDEGKFEYYFNNETKLLKNGSEVPFTELYEGAKVKVVARKIGKRLDPVTVEFVDAQ